MVVILLMVYMRGMAYGNFQELYKLLPKRNFLLLKKKRLYTNFYILMAYSCALIF